MMERPEAKLSAMAADMSICPWRSSAPSKELVTLRNASTAARAANDPLMRWNALHMTTKP